MDQKDLFAFFYNLRNEKSEEEIQIYLENCEINKLDINRMFRYLDKHSTMNIVDNNADADADEDNVMSTNI